MFVRKNNNNFSGWDELTSELDAWRATGTTATMWWRDDDAYDRTDELERLLTLSEETLTPVALAVIPFKASPRLADMLAHHSLVYVLQHGYRHHNHAPANAKKSEFGPNRPRNEMLSELAEGIRLLTSFTNLLPVLAAPWNRIDPDLLADLPDIGVLGLTCYGPRASATPAPGLKCANTHVDPINWHYDRRFVGTGAVLKQVIKHLSARRNGLVDVHEPTGFLTHHLDHDEAFWNFFDDILHRTQNHSAVRWITAGEAFQQ